MAVTARKTEQVPAEDPLPMVQVTDLVPGLYVTLTCSWVKHPFLKNSFKIRSAEHIATIQDLGLQRIKYDPIRSEPQALKALSEKLGIAPTQPAPVRIPAGDSGTDDAVAAASRAGLSEEELRLSQACKKDLTRAESAYKKASRGSSVVVREMAAGREEALTSGSHMIDTLTRWLTDSATSMAMMNLMNFKGVSPGHTLHSLHVCIISMLVGRQMELDQEQLRCLGLGALVHDIGEHKVPSQVLYKTTPLTRAERNFLHLHPHYGMDTVAQIPTFPATSIEVIEQHHERLDGSGYPQGLKDREISRLAKIVMVVDEYEEVINNTDPAKNLTPTEALSHLYVQRRGKLPSDVIIALIRVLSVYPPGTLVELSDSTIGIVISINFEASVRPQVMLYDPKLSPDTPRVINLAADQSLAIERSLRPQDIAPAVVEYLNPRRMAGHFITHSIKSLNAFTRP